MIDILIINLNCKDHTQNLFQDLMKQKYNGFTVTLVDQNSTEDGTAMFLDIIEMHPQVRVIKNKENVSIHKVWNKFVANSNKPIVCILNNDIRIPRNFLSDAVDILGDDDNIGAVMHPTNHPSYDTAKWHTDYDILPFAKHMQGWDICMRRDLWTPIPEYLEIFCGDDFIFHTMYQGGYNVAMATSSPIIHYRGSTMKNPLNAGLIRRGHDDVIRYKAKGYTHNLNPPMKYTIVEFYNSSVEFIKEP